MPVRSTMNNGSPSPSPSPEASSSRSPGGAPGRRDRDELDPLARGDGGSDGGSDDDGEVLADDPLRDDLGQPLSFKRKPKKSIFSRAGGFLAGLTGSSRREAGAGHGDADYGPPGDAPPGDDGAVLEGVASPGRGAKDGAPADWYAEGPGRRVGYEDLTAIDWIFEYTKERQRLRVLYSGATGLAGHLRRLLDASQVWVVLVLTGVAVGAIAAGINVTTDWLGDLKAGYCSAQDGGAFYLNRAFCCLGYDATSKCSGWRPWSLAMGVTSAGGRWFLEYFFFVLFSVTFAVCASLLVKEYAEYAQHSGIPEIKTVLGGFVIRRFLGMWTLVTKSLGLCLAAGSGLWLGKEGPLVHVACCCANAFTKLFANINENEARKREVLSAASAAGISVAFGSPIGGVLFSLEQLSYYFPDKTMWQSFVCAMTAAVVLQALDPFRSGKLVLYQVQYTTTWHGFELIPFALLGILGGVYGGLFIKANMRVAQWRRSARWLPGPVAQVAAVAVLTALVNYPNLYMRAQNSELVSSLFAECSPALDDRLGLCKTGAATAGTIVLLLFASVLGFLLAAVTFGLQIPAGIILPSMALGALAGRAVGVVMEIWQRRHPGFPGFRACGPDLPCVTPGVYAIIGAAATLAGVTRMTVSIVVIMFELTGALSYVLPIMVAVMLAKWVGDAFARRGIYEAWIHFDGYPFLDNSEEAALRVPDVPASAAMTRVEDLVVLTAAGHTLASLARALAAHPYRGFPVVSDPRRAVLLGYVSRAELAYTLRAAAAPPRRLPPEAEVFFAHQPLADPRATLDLRPWMDQTPLTLPARAGLHLAVGYLQKLGLRYVLFTDRGVLQGLLTKKDVWYVLNGADETRRTAGGGGGGGGVGDADRDPGAEVSAASEDGGGGEAGGLLESDDRSGAGRPGW